MRASFTRKIVCALVALSLIAVPVMAQGSSEGGGSFNWSSGY